MYMFYKKVLRTLSQGN